MTHTTTNGAIKVRAYEKTEQAKERIQKIAPVMAALDKVNERRISLLNERIKSETENEYKAARAAYFAAKRAMEKEEAKVLAKDAVINELSRTIIRTTFAVINGTETMTAMDAVGHFDNCPVCDTLQKAASAYQTISAKVLSETRTRRAKREEKTAAELLAEATAEIERLKAAMAELTATGE